mgnify:CR=1 FL=1
MKKRIKIVTTLFSLCLSILLMIVGVLASKEASLKITSSVSFEASKLICSFESTGSTTEGPVLTILINDIVAFEAKWWVSPFQDEIEISKGDVITIEASLNGRPKGDTGYYLKIYNDNNELVADAKSNWDNIEYSNNFPYTVLGNIRIVVEGYYESLVVPPVEVT